MASRFWVGGTGTWDAATTTHWSATSGGAGGQSVPGSSDTVTFDGSSGGGTVTVNFGGTITIQQLSLGGFAGTWDNSVNNNNFIITTNGGFSNIGSAVRTTKLGSATYTLSGNAASFNWSSTNLTLTATSSTITYTGSTGTRTMAADGLTLGVVNFGASSGAGVYQLTGAITFTNWNITAPNYFQLPLGTVYTVTNAFTWVGTSSAQIGIASSTPASQSTIAAAGGSTATWTAFRDMAFTGSPTATNSFDLGDNTGITISPPAGAGTGQFFSAGYF